MKTHRNLSIGGIGLAAGALACVGLMSAGTAFGGTVTYSNDFSTGTGDWAAFAAHGGTASTTFANDGAGHLKLSNGDSTTSGAYSLFGGVRPVFSSASDSLDVYIDPTASINGNYTYQWDLSTALNNSQDFIFHADGSGGNVDVSTSNNSSDGPVANPGPTIPASGSYYAISTAGWYTFEWNFLIDGSGNLQAAMNLLKQGTNTPLQTWAFNNTNDSLLATENSAGTFAAGGQPNYLWFTYLTPSSLLVDNQSLSATPTPLPASFGLVGVGSLALIGGMALRRRMAKLQ